MLDSEVRHEQLFAPGLEPVQMLGMIDPSLIQIALQVLGTGNYLEEECTSRMFQHNKPMRYRGHLNIVDWYAPREHLFYGLLEDRIQAGHLTPREAFNNFVVFQNLNRSLTFEGAEQLFSSVHGLITGVQMMKE